MSLITRCPACGTMFKVVADQLKVSQGWVRCGQCAEVFDASAHLLPRELSQALPAMPAGADVTPPLPPVAGSLLPPVALRPEGEPADSGGSPLPAEAQTPLPVAVAWPAAAADEDLDPDHWTPARKSLAVTDTDRPLEDSDAWDSTPYRLRPAEDERMESPRFDDSGPSAELAPTMEDVSFVRDARRKAFWQKPLVKAALGSVSLLLIGLLALQALIQNRDALAVTEPQLLPLIQALCGPLQCQIRSPRQIESLVIDSSAFNRIGADAYRLSFTLKNVGATPLEMPSLELTLTDSQDQAVVRRVLAPAQFGVTAPVLAARSDVSGVVALKVAPGSAAAASSPAPIPGAGILRVAGYRILAFYP